MKKVTSYTGVHNRLNRLRGKARDHACVDCGQPAHQWSMCPCIDPDLIQWALRPSGWSYDKGSRWVAFTTDLDAFDPRCSRCHRALDREFRLTRQECET